MRFRVWRPLLVIALTLPTACDSVTGQVCTLIGCTDGVSVEIEGAFDSTNTVRLSALGSPPVEQSCGAGVCGGCREGDGAGDDGGGDDGEDPGGGGGAELFHARTIRPGTLGSPARPASDRLAMR